MIDENDITACINQLKSLSDIPESLQFFHGEYEQAKAKLNVVSTETAEEHRSRKVRLQKTIREAKKVFRGNDDILAKLAEIVKPPTATINDCLVAMNDASKLASYLKWLAYLNESHGVFDRQNGDVERCLPTYDELNCYCSWMEDSRCENLKKIMKEECRRQYNILRTNALKQGNPFKWKDFDTPTVDKTKAHIKSLFEISEPLNHGESNINLGIEYLLSPLKVQFKFHFMRKVKTNDIKKPEWYLTKILSWIKEYQGVFEDVFGKLFLETSSSLFVEQLCEFAVLKMRDDLGKIDNTLFTHYVDEILKFHKELNEVTDLTQIRLPLMELFTRELTLKRWLQLETISAFEFLTNIQSDNDKFDRRDSSYNYEIPLMTVRMLTLVKATGERVRSIPSSALNNCFYTLQADILKEHLIFLTESVKKLGYNDEKYLLIINSVVYVLMVIEEWSFDTHFIKISRFEEEDVPFGKITELYKVFLADCRYSIQTSLLTKVNNKLSSYLKQSWVIHRKTDSISASASEGLMILQQALSLFNNNLSPDIFLELWSSSAKEILERIFEKILFQSNFNYNGAVQYKVDILAFTGIFQEYCSPAFFSRIHTMAQVISLPSETARLWKGEGAHDLSTLQVLMKEGNVNLKSPDALNILKRRSDI